MEAPDARMFIEVPFRAGYRYGVAGKWSFDDENEAWKEYEGAFDYQAPADAGRDCKIIVPECGTLLSPSPCSPFFVFDVESVGLHGEAFAVAGGIYINAVAWAEFRFCCPLEEAKGDEDDREWVKANVPVMEITHRHPAAVREAFWSEWEKAKKRYPGITMAGECIWPVEAGFVAACIRQEIADRKWSGPYPFHEIASVMLAADMDPMATYEREKSEKPAHEPLADARQSARLLATALRSLANDKA